MSPTYHQYPLPLQNRPAYELPPNVRGPTSYLFSNVTPIFSIVALYVILAAKVGLFVLALDGLHLSKANPPSLHLIITAITSVFIWQLGFLERNNIHLIPSRVRKDNLQYIGFYLAILVCERGRRY